MVVDMVPFRACYSSARTTAENVRPRADEFVIGLLGKEGTLTQ